MQEAGHGLIKMAPCILSLLDRVCSAWVGHHREGLVVLDEFVDQLQVGLIVAVVVYCPMDEKEIALEVLSEVYGRSLVECLPVFHGQSHVSLLIDGIVVFLVGDRCHRDGRLIEIGKLEDGIQAH